MQAGEVQGREVMRWNCRKDVRYGMPAVVHVAWAEGREYFYFRKSLDRKDERPVRKAGARPPYRDICACSYSIPQL